MAGNVGVELARTSPELLRTLVLVDPAGPVSVLPDPEAARRRLDGMSRLAQGIRAQLDSTGDRAKAAAFGANAAFGPGVFERWPEPIRKMFADNIGTLAATPDMDPPSLDCGDGRRFGMPVLIMHGERSPKYYLDLSAGLRNCRQGIEPTVVVPNAGHNMQIDNPAFFNTALLAFFAKN
jgi:pimeloyl-ACP methyl ester carboxylesterase